MKLPAVVEPELKMAVVTSPALVDVSLKVGVPVTAPVFVDAPLNAGEPVIGPVFGELLKCNRRRCDRSAIATTARSESN